MSESKAFPKHQGTSPFGEQWVSGESANERVPALGRLAELFPSGAASVGHQASKPSL